MDEAERPDRVVVLDRSVVRDDGAPDAVVARHHTPSLERAFLDLTDRT